MPDNEAILRRGRAASQADCNP